MPAAFEELPERFECLFKPASCEAHAGSFYVWLTNQLGQGDGRNHETLIGVRGTPGGANDEVRFGEIKGVIGTNEVPSDNLSPKQDQWGMGPVIAGGEWTCIEVAFLGDTENHEVVGWNNGVDVHRVNDPNQWQNGSFCGTGVITTL